MPATFFLASSTTTSGLLVERKMSGRNYIANSLKKKCKKKFYLGIHDRFIRDEKFRKNMIDNGRTEETCRKMDEPYAPPDPRRNSRIQS